MHNDNINPDALVYYWRVCVNRKQLATGALKPEQAGEVQRKVAELRDKYGQWATITLTIEGD